MPANPVGYALEAFVNADIVNMLVLKRVSIAHAIISASRRSLSSPLLFGVGVQLDHSFGSKWLNNHMSRLGFSAKYDEVQSYKKAAMETENIIPDIPSGSFGQWSADNVDHNTRTLDGKNTFHGMGIIASITPSLESPTIAIGRLNAKKSMKEISCNKSISISEYMGRATLPAKVKFKPCKFLHEAAHLKKDSYRNLDFAWVSSFTIHRTFCNWSGFMQAMFSLESSFDKSTVVMLPLIDLNPSDPTCIYSMLLFVSQQAERQGIIPPCLTFNQPLWLKASAIIEEKNMSIV